MQRFPIKKSARSSESCMNEQHFAADALEFTILTAARTSEVLGARWEEIDLTENIWIVPKDRMKAGKEHRVPLSKPAIEVLERVRYVSGGEGCLFPGAKKGAPLSNMAFLMLLKRMGYVDATGKRTITAHGFRSSFRDWAAEETDFDRDAVELSLAHTIGSKVEQAYRRKDMLEKRRLLMEAWGEYCTPSRSSPEARNPIPADTELLNANATSV